MSVFMNEGKDFSFLQRERERDKNREREVNKKKTYV